MEQTECSDNLKHKIQTSGIIQKKAYNVQNRAKGWNQDLNLTRNSLKWKFTT